MVATLNYGIKEGLKLDLDITSLKLRVTNITHDEIGDVNKDDLNSLIGLAIGVVRNAANAFLDNYEIEFEQPKPLTIDLSDTKIREAEYFIYGGTSPRFGFDLALKKQFSTVPEYTPKVLSHQEKVDLIAQVLKKTIFDKSLKGVDMAQLSKVQRAAAQFGYNAGFGAPRGTEEEL